MNISVLTAISPIDGRYRGKTEPLAEYFSEYALIRYRIRVEIEYFITLCELPLPQLQTVDHALFDQLRDIYRQFTPADAQRVKDIEKVTNHDVKAVEYFIKEKLDAMGGFEQYKEFIQVMKELAGYALKQGVDIYFETGQETPTTLIRAIKDIGTGNCFINCDTGNLLLYGKANPTDAIRQFGPLVKDLHAKDGTYPSREDPYHLGKEKKIPEGDVDFPTIIKLLKKQGYEGSITIECELNGKNMEYLSNTRKYLQKLIDKK